MQQSVLAIFQHRFDYVLILSAQKLQLVLPKGVLDNLIDQRYKLRDVQALRVVRAKQLLYKRAA
ncbi:hypothetical protein D3C87_1583730 [compost metagenome]